MDYRYLANQDHPDEQMELLEYLSKLLIEGQFKPEDYHGPDQNKRMWFSNKESMAVQPNWNYTPPGIKDTSIPGRTQVIPENPTQEQIDTLRGISEPAAPGKAKVIMSDDLLYKTEKKQYK